MQKFLFLCWIPLISAMCSCSGGSSSGATATFLQAILDLTGEVKGVGFLGDSVLTLNSDPISGSGFSVHSNP